MNEKEDSISTKINPNSQKYKYVQTYYYWWVKYLKHQIDNICASQLDICVLSKQQKIIFNSTSIGKSILKCTFLYSVGENIY